MESDERRVSNCCRHLDTLFYRFCLFQELVRVLVQDAIWAGYILLGTS